MSRSHYRALDGLRAIAVLIVLFSHAGAPYPRSGGVGVDIFFVLSGFLITTILASEVEAHGNLSFWNFYARRGLRLAPCLLLTCALFAVWMLVTHHVFPAKQLVFVLGYLANWARGIFDVPMHTLAHSWSLAIEEQFYLLWPFAVLFLERVSRSSAIKGATLFGSALLLAAYRYGVVDTFTARRIYFGLDTHADGLVMGSALCYVVQAVRQMDGLSDRQSKLVSYLAAPASIVTLLIMMKLVTWEDPFMGRYGFFLVALASTVLIGDLVLSPRSLLKGVLSLKPAVFLGRISYGIYLLHLPIYYITGSFFPHVEAYGLKVCLALFKMLITVLAASASYYLIEARFLKLKCYFVRPSLEHDAAATFQRASPYLRKRARHMTVPHSA